MVTSGGDTTNQVTEPDPRLHHHGFSRSGLAVLNDLVELAQRASQGTWSRLELAVTPPLCIVHGTQPHPTAQPGIDDPSTLSLPISGSASEPGQLTVGGLDAAHQTQDRIDGVRQVARTIEAWLDRLTEEHHLDQLGERLRTHQHELTAIKDRLALSNQELEQFAYLAAHELVAPLRAVAVYAELLEQLSTGQQTNDDEYLRACVSEIRTGVTMMSDQVHGLLGLSQVEVDAGELEVVDLRDAVNGALDTFSTVLHRIDASVTVGWLPLVHGALVPLQSVFANLISNAIRYRRRDQHLEINITAESRDEGATIWVADNGTGIDATDRTRVFQLFERASTTTEGSGIGLALTRRIVHALNGTIGIEPNHHDGSRFWIWLPTPTPT